MRLGGGGGVVRKKLLLIRKINQLNRKPGEKMRGTETAEVKSKCKLSETRTQAQGRPLVNSALADLRQEDGGLPALRSLLKRQLQPPMKEKHVQMRGNHRPEKGINYRTTTRNNFHLPFY